MGGRKGSAGRPTKADLERARGATVPDVLGPGLDVVFVGINPGLWSGAVGHHFARPGNRFWKALHASGFTGRTLAPAEERTLLELGIGITNLVQRVTATADELSGGELRAGAALLAERLEPLRPSIVAFLGIGAYRIALGRPTAAFGRQPAAFAGAETWVLPNPSGLNAHHQLDDLAMRFGEVRAAAAGRRRKR